MGPVSIGVEVQRNTDGDTPSSRKCVESKSSKFMLRDCIRLDQVINELSLYSKIHNFFINCIIK